MLTWLFVIESASVVGGPVRGCVNRVARREGDGRFVLVHFCFEGFDLVVFGGQLGAQSRDDAGFAADWGEVDGGGVAAVLIDHRDEVAIACRWFCVGRWRGRRR